ncbi:MAG: carboxymuconolactone decarboxylase family protein [Amaricoccus sp.]|uniref:carboxymuconolactone decarboxylase family protein n=1 Tax=Amaricoccus sp. TaxID=1872485 RepID=UPI0039E534C0
MPDNQQLKDKFVGLHGYWTDDLAVALETDADFFGDYLQMAEVALGAEHLDLKIRHLVLIAANAAVTHLNGDAVSQHVGAALDVGATKEEILETLQIASVLGIHSYTEGAPLLLDMLAQSDDPKLKDAFPRGEAYQAVKTEFADKRGYWNDLLDAMVRTSPEFVMGYTAFSSTPWRKGTLSPMVRELLYVAIDSSTTHLYNPGSRIHGNNALRYGATPEQVLQVMQLVVLIGMQSFLVGTPRLLAEIERRGKS